MQTIDDKSIGGSKSTKPFLVIAIVVVSILNILLSIKSAPPVKSSIILLSYSAGYSLGFPLFALLVSQLWRQFRNSVSRYQAFLYPALVILLINLAGLDTARDTMSLSDQLALEAEDLNKKLPNRSNPENVLEKVIAEGNTLVYMYRFPNYRAGEVSIDPQQKAAILNAGCDSDSPALANGATIEYRYHTKDWQKVEKISYNLKICRELSG